MKKNKLVYLLFTIFLGFIFITNTKAVVLSQSEYEKYGIERSYVIGKYIFDMSKHNPTLFDLVRAAASSGLDDGGDVSIIEIIVAENLDGELERRYLSLETGEELKTFPKLDVKYIYRSAIMPKTPEKEDKDILKEIVLTPTLSNVSGEITDGKITAKMTILNTGAYSSGTNNISGIELYEKNGPSYSLVTSYEDKYTFDVEVTDGQSKVFVVRVYVKESDGTKTYSDYSNEIELDYLRPRTPKLLNKTIEDFNETDTVKFVPTLTDGKYVYDLAVDHRDYLQDSTVTNFVLYEKDKDSYKELKTGTVDGTVSVEIEPGTKKVYVVKVYKVGSFENRIYSEYSNEVTIDHTNYTISYVLGDKYGENRNPDFYTYGVGVSKLNDPTKVGCKFLGWYREDTYTNKVTSLSTSQSGNLILYAKWSVYGDVDGDGKVDTSDITVLRRYLADENDVPDTFNKDMADVDQDGMIDDVDLQILRKYNAGGYDITLPYDSGEKYTISYDLSGGKLAERNLTTYAAISLPFTLKNPTKEGYVFAGWTGSNGEIPEIDLAIVEGTSSNLAYKANWYQLTKPSITAVLLGNSEKGLNYGLFLDVFLKNETTGLVSYTKESGQGVQVWTSTDGEEYVLEQTISYEVLKETEKGNILIEVLSRQDKYVKVRTYAEADDEKVYSEYSNVLELAGSKTLLGDVNNDSKLDNNDLEYLEGYLNGNEDYELDDEQMANSDLNEDGEIDDVDLEILKKYLDKKITELPYDSGNKYTITYNLSGGTFEGKYTKVYSEISLPLTIENPKKLEHQFLGWTGSNGTTQQMDVTIEKGTTGNLEYTANWKVNEYTVTFNPNGGTVTPTSKKVGYYRPYGELPTPVRPGYDFTGWYAPGGEKIEATSTLNNGKDVTLNARWTLIGYTITYNLDGGEATNVNSFSVDTPTFTLNNPTKDGYDFIGWTGSNGTTPQMEVTIEKGTVKNLTYTANWKIKSSLNITAEFVSADENKSIYRVETGAFWINEQTGFCNYSNDKAEAIEIWTSTDKVNYEKTLVYTGPDCFEASKTGVDVYVDKNQTLYVKARTYVTVDEKKVYSEYSNVLELTGLDNFKYGDITLDDEVSFVDLFELGKFLNDEVEFTETQEQNADLNNDNEIDDKDYYILKYYLYDEYNGIPVIGNMYKVDFYNGDEIHESVWVLGNHKCLDDIINPEKDGYVFDDWYVDDSKFSFNSPINKDLKVDAHFNYDTSSPSISLLPSVDNDYEIVFDKAISANQIEIYSASTENGTYTLYDTMDVALNGKNTFTKGENDFYKIRLKKSFDGDIIYTDFSNIVKITISDKEVVLSKEFVDYEYRGYTTYVIYDLKLNDYTDISHINLYESTTETGKYSLKKSFSVSNMTEDSLRIELDQNATRYYKVKVLFKNGNNISFSNYSNTVKILANSI